MGLNQTKKGPAVKIVLTGGGTGGHITPILAVAHELKQLEPSCKTVYVGEKGGKFTSLTSEHQAIDKVYAISAGKFRRYHGESWLRRITDVKSIVLNIRDVFRVASGIFQAWRILGIEKPDIVFLKGGFVGVPVGLAAAMRRIPIITHDSDIVPGLANRLVSRWVTMHATALPAKFYKYPASKVVTVGVLVEHNYQPVDDSTQEKYKTKLKIPADEQLLLVTGGSSGAERINKAVVAIINELLENHSKLHVVHQVGRGKLGIYNGFRHDRLHIMEFLNPMYLYTGAADLIVTRAGANAMAEFGVQGKACIVVPNPDLTGGHQTKNADRWEEQGAARIVREGELYNAQHGLLSAINELLANKALRIKYANVLQQNTIVGAAQKLAELIVQTNKKIQKNDQIQDK